MSQKIKIAFQQSAKDAEQYILGERKGKIFNITFNRPDQSNAFTLGMYMRLDDLFDQAQKDDMVDVILVSANGKNFSSGNDLNNFSMTDFSQPAIVVEFVDTMTELLTSFTLNILNLKKPIICCCQGAVVGFIFPLLQIFDLIYVTEDAYFVAPMVKMEQSLEMFASYTFPRLFGPGKAFELLVLGDKLTAAEAVQTKFAQKMFKTQIQMMNHAIQTCEQLSQMNNKCVQKAKSMMKESIKTEMWKANLSELNNLNSVQKDPAFTQSLKNYMKNIKLKPKL